MLKNKHESHSKAKCLKTGIPVNFLVLSISLLLSSVTLVSAEIHEHDSVNTRDQHEDHDEHQQQDEHIVHDEHDEHDEHNDHAEDDHEGETHQEDAFVKISSEQQAMAGIKAVTIKAEKHINQIVSAPGEVVNDLYNTTLLTTQIDSKVIKRKVVLGQYVKKGDVIAVLYSLNIDTLQNQLKVSLSEWQRVKKLGREIVGAQRFISTRAAYEKNKSILQAYGFGEALIEQFIIGNNHYKAGEYPVAAPHDGVILEDNFQSGQFLPAGATIALLVDENTVWVDALLSPEIGQVIPVGIKARVIIGNKTFFSKVIHDSHVIDETTRTHKIRLLIENKEHLLHAGLFANVFLELPLSEKVILLPETALMRSSDGDWTVFIEQESGVFRQKEVELKNTINGMHSIKGLKSGQQVVIEGAFFLASEMAKGGFDPHNH